jgi:hypothetical protein
VIIVPVRGSNGKDSIARSSFHRVGVVVYLYTV